MTGFQVPHFGLTRQYQNLKHELLEASIEVLSSGIYLNGPKTKQFEDWLSKKTNCKYATVVHSGTQALEIIARYKLEAHQKIVKGTPKIRVPNLTYPATLNSFLTTGWEVELADTDRNGVMLEYEKDGTYDCVVGFAGRNPSMDIDDKSFGVIVDGAQHWLESNEKIGVGMAISFDPTKNLPSSGNGGAIVTNNKLLFDFAVNYKNNGKLSNFNEVGTNSKISEQDCAHLLVRSGYIDSWQIRRKLISKFFCENFKNLPIRCLNDTNDNHAHQKFVIYSNRRNEVAEKLKQSSIETKFSYDYTLSDLGIAKNLKKPDFLSTSSMLSKGLIALPIYPELTDYEVEYITESLIKIFR